MSGIEKRIKKHACIFVKDLSFISVRYIGGSGVGLTKPIVWHFITMVKLILVR